MTAKEFSKTFGESTIKLLILIVITYGLYSLIWISERSKLWNKLADRDVFNRNLLVLATICNGLAMFTLVFIPVMIDSHIDIGNVIDTLSIFDIFYRLGSLLILVIVWKVGNWFELYCAKEFRIDLKVNKILLIIFNILYLNYLFNSLTMKAEKEQLLHSYNVS